MKYILFLALIASMPAPLVADQNHKQNSSNVAATEYVLNYLKKSSTKYRGSQDWKEQMLERNAHANTVYAQTNHEKYYGVMAQLYRFLHKKNHLPVSADAVSGQFALRNNGDEVEIDSTITSTKVTKAKSYQEAQLLKAQAHKPQLENQSDGCTQCTLLIKSIFNENGLELEKTTISRCRSKIPVDEFENAMSEK